MDVSGVYPGKQWRNTSVYRQNYEKLPGRFPSRESFDLLLQIQKHIRVEEILDTDPKPITKLFDCGDGHTIVASADDIVDCGLGHTTFYA